MTMEVLADWVSRISNVVWNGLLLYLLLGHRYAADLGTLEFVLLAAAVAGPAWAAKDAVIAVASRDWTGSVTDRA